MSVLATLLHVTGVERRHVHRNVTLEANQITNNRQIDALTGLTVQLSLLITLLSTSREPIPFLPRGRGRHSSKDQPRSHQPPVGVPFLQESSPKIRSEHHRHFAGWGNEADGGQSHSRKNEDLGDRSEDRDAECLLPASTPFC